MCELGGRPPARAGDSVAFNGATQALCCAKDKTQFKRARRGQAPREPAGGAPQRRAHGGGEPAAGEVAAGAAATAGVAEDAHHGLDALVALGFRRAEAAEALAMPVRLHAFRC